MERIKSFLYEYSWLLKTGIVFALIFWALQGWSGVVYMSKYSEQEESTESIRFMTDEERDSFLRAREEVLRFCYKVLDQAREKNKTEEGYTHYDYFNDKKRIRAKNAELYPKVIDVDFPINVELSGMHLRNKHANQYDFDIAKEGYKKWLRESNVPKSRDDFYLLAEDEKQEPVDWTSVFQSITGWILTCYLRGFGLALLLYLIRMSDYFSKGILGTILADKKRFLLAVLFWPVFLMKYPSNVIREVVVEAELRRMGNLFRKFTSEERELVCRVAESANFWRWIFNFHSENQNNFQKSFVVALVVTILINLVPIQVQADDFDQCELTRDGPEIVLVLFVSDCDETDNQKICDCFKGIALFDNSLRLRANLLTAISFFRLRIFQAKEFFQKIDHVPISGCLFAEVFMIQGK